MFKKTTLLAMLAGASFAVNANASETNTLRVAPTENNIVFDGHVSQFEYSDATKTKIKGPAGLVDAFIKQDKEYLNFAFILPNPHYTHGDDIVIMLEPKNAKGKKPSDDATRAYIRRKSEWCRTHKGIDGKWEEKFIKWEHKSFSYKNGWEVEARIKLSELPIKIDKETEMGLSFRIWDNVPGQGKGKWNWPEKSDENKPNTWGTLIINSVEPKDNKKGR